MSHVQVLNDAHVEALVIYTNQRNFQVMLHLFEEFIHNLATQAVDNGLQNWYTSYY